LYNTTLRLRDSSSTEFHVVYAIIILYYANWQQIPTRNQYNNTENLQKQDIENRIKHTTIYEKQKCSTINHTIHEN